MPLEERWKINLSGTWSFALDPDDIGCAEGWYNRDAAFDRTVQVPGAWQAQGIGDHKHRPAPAQSKMPPVEMEKVSYRGTGWYRRVFNLPENWRAKQVWLNMGGAHPVCEIWIDGKFVHKHLGSQLQYRLNITGCVRPGGGHVLTIRISEYPGEPQGRNYRNPLSGAFLDWCNTWSGLYRDVWLEAKDAVRIDSVSVFPDIKHSIARVRVALDRTGSKAYAGLRIRAAITGPDGLAAGAGAARVDAADAQAVVELAVAVRDARLWSPDTPVLYGIAVTLGDAGGGLLDEYADRFGMREFGVDGGEILLNGQPIWLRGFGDHVMFPLTLHPGIERPQIEKELKRAREYGFNFVLHYTMPFKEYLDVADEVGLLVQESPLLTSARCGDREVYMQPAYLEQCIRQNINHPSVMFYTFTAEVYFHNAGSPFIRDLACLARAARALDPSRLINVCAGVDRASAERDDTDVLELAGGNTCNPAELDVCRKPVILHEYRWWSSYPNPRLKKKYAQSAMRPWFIEHAEKVAREKGFEDLLPVFVENSEKLQALERKIGLEKARRAQGVRGYELFLGKDTGWAIEGLWDDFGDPKNVSAAEFLQTNGETVLLIDKDYYYRNYWSGEKIAVDLWLSHFGHTPIRDGRIEWKLVSAAGVNLAEGQCALPAFPCHATEKICRLQIFPAKVTASTRATLQVALVANTGVCRNNWNFWIFDRDLVARPTGRIARIGVHLYYYDLDFFELKTAADPLAGFDCVVTNTLNGRLLDYLQRGGKVLLIAQGVFPELACEFKSNLYNGSAEGNSGTVIRNHPALGRFPHDGWCDLQFYGLIEDAPVINLDKWPVRIDPIIRSINNYQLGIQRAYLCEARVGQGALLTTTFNFKPLRGIGRYYCEVENTYLFDQLLRYIMGPDFKPAAEVPVAFLESLAGRRAAPTPADNTNQNPAYLVNSGIR